jgi:hypothetical protein
LTLEPRASISSAVGSLQNIVLRRYCAQAAYFLAGTFNTNALDSIDQSSRLKASDSIHECRKKRHLHHFQGAVTQLVTP